jgi:hypothetical protein
LAATQQTFNYDAVYTTTLINHNKTLVDNISQSNLILYTLMKDREDGYVPIEGGLGVKAQIALMYGLGSAEPYSDYDIIDTSPVDGMTSAFWDWRQLATTVQISRMEEQKNSGEAAVIRLLKGKIKQATITIQEKFSRALMQGQGITDGTSITSPYQNPSTGKLFLDPLPLMVKFDPTTGLVGSIDPATETWWRNQIMNDASASYAAFLYNLDDLYNRCVEHPGGKPNLHVTDRRSYQLYVAALRSQNRFVEYGKADIPFETVLFHGSPVTWDTYMVDAAGGSTTQSTTSGTWYMLNMKFLQIQYDPDTNFMNTPFQTPPDQDARVSKILWYGAFLQSQRRKQGVQGSIDTTIAA